jgi:hypothetical protein
MLTLDNKLTRAAPSVAIERADGTWECVDRQQSAHCALRGNRARLGAARFHRRAPAGNKEI